MVGSLFQFLLGEPVKGERRKELSSSSTISEAAEHGFAVDILSDIVIAPSNCFCQPECFGLVADLFVKALDQKRSEPNPCRAVKAKCFTFNRGRIHKLLK